MSANPYASPAPAFDVPGGGTHVYRPANRLVLWLTISLVTLMICDGVVTAASGVVELSFPGLMDKEDYEPSEAITVMALGVGFIFGGLGLLGALLACVILFCMTVNRFNKNARALGSKGMEYSPGWTVGWFFIPIANLFKPYQAIRETYQASDPRTGDYDWRQSQIQAPLGWWWTAWIVSNIVDNIETRLAWRQITVPVEVSLGVSALSLVLTIAAGVLAICVVRAILARQEEKAAAQSSKTAAKPFGMGNAFA